MPKTMEFYLPKSMENSLPFTDDNPLADAITDRIVYDAYKINIESADPSKDISMREVYGIDKNQAQ